jgi:hypothetical protein
MRLVNIKQLAKALNVSASGVGHMMRDLDFPVYHRGKGSIADPHMFDLDAVLAYREERAKQKERQKIARDSTKDRVWEVKAQFAEMELKKFKDKHVYIDDARQILDEEMGQLRTVLLELPPKLRDHSARDHFRLLLIEALDKFHVDFDAV